MKNEDLLDLSISNREQEFVNKALDLELDVTIDIFEMLSDIPCIGSLLKLGMVGSKYMELQFIKKVAKFLRADIEISQKEKLEFLDKLSAKKRKRMVDYILQYILRAEDDEKADLMGYIYKACVLGQIDYDMFLRLCSIVDHAFLYDLRMLPMYVNRNEEYTIAANNFINLGLIDNSVSGMLVNVPSYKLNGIGLKLHDILEKNKWFISDSE